MYSSYLLEIIWLCLLFVIIYGFVIGLVGSNSHQKPISSHLRSSGYFLFCAYAGVGFFLIMFTVCGQNRKLKRSFKNLFHSYIFYEILG